MDLRLSFEIAKIHLLSRKKQTLIAAMGVTFGIGMFIGLVSLMTGLNNFTEQLTMTSTPDIRIYNDVAVERPSILEELNPNNFNVVHHQKPKDEQPNLRNAFQIAEIIRKDPQVQGAAPQLSSQVFYNYGPIKLNGNISGVDIKEEDKLFDIKSKMKSGKIEDLITSTDGIIMGTGLARKLHVQKDDRVTVTTPEGQTLKLKVVGTFQMGIGIIDNVKSYANISKVQNILQKDTRYVTEINVKLNDYTTAKPFALRLNKQFGYKAEDWETANATMLLGNKIRNILTSAVTLTLLLVAGFGIYNILSMGIQSKMKDIAILKATGFAAKDVMRIFMIQSIIIGLVGSLAGLTLGYLIAFAISKAPFNGGDFISLDHFPVSFKPVYYIIGIIFGVITTSLAGYFPSRRAGKIDPIEILRGQ